MALLFVDGTVSIEMTPIADDLRLVITDKFGFRKETVLAGTKPEHLDVRWLASVHRRFSMARTGRN